ncbi:hypothetical protein BC830DRAFT_1059194 [Chytriomyces sp. MP71]|nr:hypothetical protein BC830DRAFT_1059194 [Chytriomyces sp. MP71]
MPITRRLDQITNIYNSWTIDTVDAIVTTMTTNAFSLNNLDSLPIGVALPLREFLSACRRNPHNGWTVEYYAMIGREDFAEQASGNKCLTLHKSVPLPQHRVRLTLVLYQPVAMEPATELLSGVELENSEVTNLRFQDDRIEVVQKIMTCRQVPSLNAKVFADSTDDLIRSEQQNVLMSFANKLFALPIGRALFTFGTASNAVSETVHFPQVTVSAKLPPLNDVVHLDPTQAPQDLFEWPNFHNGVATGLRIPESSTAVHASWLEKNNPSTPTCNNGGFIFAMGLLGHLKKLERWQRMVYLQHQHVVTTVGMVLGVGASLCGTGDAYATKLMKVHIPRLNNFGPSGDRVDGASNVASEGTRCTGGVTHTASVFGLGLLHLGTSKRRFVEVLIDEIAAVDYALDDGSDSGAEGSFNERVKNREGHSVTAGLALGMVVLGKGSMARGLDGIGLLERLLGHIAGKGRDGIDGAGGEISAAGATIALGLMYLKTGDESVAAKLEIPETRHMLDYVRSDLLLVRTLSRNLVLWDATRATKQWIEDQVPAYVQEVVLLFDDDDGSLESLRHARYNIIAGACLSLAIKFAGSSSEEVFRLLLKYLDDFNLEASFPAITYREKLNKSVVRTCCDVIVVSLGVVMAGSGNLELLRRFHKLSDRISTDVSYGSHMALQMALGFLFLGGAAGFTLGSSDQAVAALVCALYPRFPMSAEDNCCHLQPLRHMWVMAVERRRCLVVRDVESRQACRIPVLITLKGDGKGTYPLVLRTWAPCILPELTRIKSVSVDSDRYLSLTVVGDEYLRRLFDTHTLFVKRKSGHLDYVKVTPNVEK